MAIIPDALGITLTFGTSGFTFEMTSITPPGIEGGEKIPLTHLGTTEFRRYFTKTLKDLTDLNFSGHYEPSLLLSAPINTNELITVTYPDGGTHTFQGSLNSFTPGDATEGERVECSGTVVALNKDASLVDVDPAYVAPV